MATRVLPRPVSEVSRDPLSQRLPEYPTIPSLSDAMYQVGAL